MKKFLYKFEFFVDKSIPYLLILLLFILITEIFFHDFAYTYHTPIMILDALIVTIFVVDLLFKLRHSKKIKFFLKNYWLEILAVLPFFLVFRVVEEIGLLRLAVSESTQTAQQALHVGTGVEKEVTAAERFARTTRFQRFMRPALRSVRFLKAAHFFEHPKAHKK